MRFLTVWPPAASSTPQVVRSHRKQSYILASLLTLTVLFVGVSAGSASATEPWWHVSTVYAPARQAGGEGQVDVEVSNLGDKSTDGTFEEHLVEAVAFDETKGFIEVVEKLPAGLTVSEAEEPVHAEGSGTPFGGESEHLLENIFLLEEEAGATVPKLCSVSGQVVRCLYGTPVRPYERIVVSINVEATPGAGTGISEASVTGGGAGAVVSRRMLSPDQTVASYGVENYELTPEEEGGGVDTQAGSHPFQLTTTFELNQQTAQAYKSELGPHNRSGAVEPEAQPLGLTKDLHFDIPPGLIGNPVPLPKCSLVVFTQESKTGEPKCPRDTQVGVSSPILTARRGIKNLPEAISVALYNLEPAVGEPARFGFQTTAGPVILDTSVRTGGGYGVVVTVPNIVDLPLLGNQLTFWGVPADPRHDAQRSKECLVDDTTPQNTGGEELLCSANARPQPFLIMPTSCTGPLKTSMEADSWAEPGAFRQSGEYTFQTGVGGLGEPYGMDGCNRLSFEPSISVAPDGQQASTPTGLTVGIHVPQEEGLDPTGLADSTVKSTTVILPAGVGLNPAAADGLSACGLDEIGLESPAEQSCPESAKVATVEIRTPLLPNPLVGAAYLATPAPLGESGMNPFGSLIAMYIVAKDPVSGVLIKVAGEVKPNPATGQLVATFKETPQLPFEDLSLNFFGGSRAPLGTPASCGGYTTLASIEPWSGNTAIGSSSEFKITSGPNGSPCSSPLPFSPSLTTGSTNLQAGAFTPFTMTMSREDGNQNLQAIQLKMPPGLSGLLAGVKLCGETEGNAGTCGPESLIGETTVSVGLGANPYTVTGGKVYITGPYNGAPFGLSIVNPANAGPFHLGNVIVRAKIEVDPHTAALTITSDNTGPYKIPQYIDGIPLQIKHVNVTINHPGFTFNPTNCSPMAITGSLSSSEGSTQTLGVPFQVTNCATLKFEPKFAVSTSGKTSKAKGASLAVKLTYPKAAFGTQANIKQVKVDLPKQLPSRLTTLQKACTAKQFDTNPASCPAASIIGHGKAITPLVPVPLEGPAYFVSNGGEAFPNLIVVLQGYGVTIDLVGDTFISKAGITSSTFKTVPDQPVGSFELNLPQGTYSALAANGNLCTTKLTMPTEFTAQNGAVIHQNTPIAATGCPKAKTAAQLRAHKLATALKTCHKKHGSKRTSCEKAARKKYKKK
jgi:hypothetical protein